MAEADGEVAVRDPNQVISEIESTRENLARTIDALTERVSPGNVARRSLDRVREHGRHLAQPLLAGSDVGFLILLLGEQAGRLRIHLPTLMLQSFDLTS